LNDRRGGVNRPEARLLTGPARPTIVRGPRRREATGVRASGREPVLLGLGVALTTATQLRVPMGPVAVGPGEALLAAWMAWTMLGWLRGGRPSWPQGARHVGVFWAIAALWLVLGHFALRSSGIASHRNVMHDALAYLFTAAFTVLLVTRGLDTAARDRVLGTLCVAVAIGLGLLGGAAAWSPRIGPLYVLGSLHPGEDGGYRRFLGWAENPNQIGLLLAFLPFAAEHARVRLRDVGRPALWMACGLALLGIGLLARGRAVWMAWGVGLLAFVVASLRLRRARQASIGPAGPPPAWTLLLVAVPAIAATLLGRHGAPDSQRLGLWTSAIEAIARSPLVGLGPGTHAGIGQRAGWDEAHNTLLDWGTSTGVPGALALAIVIGLSLRNAWRSRSPGLCGALAAMWTFAMFHHMLRHPALWLLVVIASTGGDPAARETLTPPK